MIWGLWTSKLDHCRWGLTGHPDKSLDVCSAKNIVEYGGPDEKVSVENNIGESVNDNCDIL